MSYGFQSVLVATDFSDASLNAVRTAAAIYKRQCAALRILHVDYPFRCVHPANGALRDGGSHDCWCEKTDWGRTPGFGRADWRPVRHCLHSRRGDGPLVEAIEQYTTEHDCDLIVMGSVGASGL